MTPHYSLPILYQNMPIDCPLQIINSMTVHYLQRADCLKMEK